MTEVQKVSIGGYAFTLEVDAYHLVKQYLDELNEYYSRLEGGSEVMEGFEERMAELLYEKCADDGVASVPEVQEILDILGKPSVIESDEGPEPRKTAAGEEAKAKTRKRLYRDPTGKMIGGVCSGLAAYFKFDVVLIRIIFIGLFILGPVLDNHWFVNGVQGVTLIAYILLWIAMPEARTVQQRWELGVMNPPSGAAGAAAATASRPVGSTLGKVLRIVIGCLLLFTAVVGLTSGLAVIFGWSVFGRDILAELIDAQILHLPSSYPLVFSVFYRILLLLVCLLPFVGMLYGGIMMVFDLRTPSWRPGLVIFLLWVIALTASAVMALMEIFHHF